MALHGFKAAVKSVPIRIEFYDIKRNKPSKSGYSDQTRSLISQLAILKLSILPTQIHRRSWPITSRQFMQFRSQTQSSNKKTKRGISYGRVSTFDQAFNKDGNRREDASPEAQRSRCSDHVRFLSSKNKGDYQILEHISDEGFSGKNTKRPGYQKMWDLVSSNIIDFIVASELSRISRSVIDFLELVAHCEANQVDLVIIGLDLDTSSPIGRVMVIILVALAQFEREMTSQRVKENGLNRLLKDGKINGAAEILGLSRDPERAGHFLVNEEELLKVEQITQAIFEVFEQA